MVNPDLYKESYAETDPFAPVHFGMDYLFASVMLSNPLFWMELQFLSKERRAQLAPLMKVWKEIREDIASADVFPIGEHPNGRSLTGFAVKGKERSYLLLFREVTARDTLELKLGENVEILRTVISNTEVTTSTCRGSTSVTLASPRAYALLAVDFKE